MPRFWKTRNLRQSEKIVKKGYILLFALQNYKRTKWKVGGIDEIGW